jgi:transcriptional regulator with XRE-family HTH domain
MTTKYTNQRPKVQPPVAALAALRKSHGMTQPDVIARIKDAAGRTYTVGALSALEKGHRGASVQFLSDVAAVFGLEADDLWTSYKLRDKDRDAA